MKRKCVICDKGSEPDKIYTFDQVLRDLEIEGRYAHPMCVLDAQAERRAAVQKYGRPVPCR